MNEPQEIQSKPEAGLPLGEARCYATFELGNQETVTPCHLQRGHEGDHEGWCLGSRAHWPRDFISEYEFRRMLAVKAAGCASVSGSGVAGTWAGRCETCGSEWLELPEHDEGICADCGSFSVVEMVSLPLQNLGLDSKKDA